METHNQLIGARIKQLRLAKDLSGDQLAEVLKLSKSAISKIEKGKSKLNTDQLLTLGKLFDKSVSYLMCEDRPVDGGAFGAEVEEEVASEMEMLKAQLKDALKDKEMYRSIVESPLVQQALGKLSGDQKIALVDWLKSLEKTFVCAYKEAA